MVRVFSAYHYRGQDVHTVSEDILASCLMDNDHIILAKSNHIIEIRSISNSENDEQQHQNDDDEEHNKNILPNGSSAPMCLSFATVNQVQKIVYSKHGKFH